MTTIQGCLRALAMGACLVATPAAQAVLLTDASEVGSSLVVNFDSPAGSGLTSPVDVGTGTGFTVNFSAVGAPGSVGIAPAGVWLLGDNGLWGFDPASGGDKTFAGVDGDFAADGSVVSMVFDFGGLTVQKVGAFMSYDPGYTFGGPELGLPLPLYIAAYDSRGALLDSHDLPIIPAGEDALNAGGFFGIGWSSASIARFEVVGPYAVVDDLVFTTPVPEPSTWALMGAGLVLIGAAARRRSSR